MKWKETLKSHFDTKVKTSEFVKQYYKAAKINIEDAGIHLAVFAEPFFSLLIEGDKTVESRFSVNRVPPYQKVNTGDIVYVKKTGGNVFGFFIVGEVLYYNSPKPAKLNELKKLYSGAICSEAVEGFWESRQSARFISLLFVLELRTVNPFNLEKRDRTAWAVIKAGKERTNENVIWKN